MAAHSSPGSSRTDEQRTALRDAVAVVLSSAELLERHIDRMSRSTRDHQLTVLRSAAMEVLCGVELLAEGEP
jgi:hypothetical protein